jgi:hypothetical protein
LKKRLKGQGEAKKAKKKEWPCGVCENHNRCDYTYCKSCNIAKGALELENAWVCGVSDTRVRTAILFRAMARLYHFRREDRDNGRAMHWNKTAIMISALPLPLVTQTQVEELISIRGIGAATVRMMSEIFLTGSIDYIDDLLHEVRVCVHRPSSVTAIGEIEERVHRLATTSPEQRRAFRREKALAFARLRAEEQRERVQRQRRQSRSQGESDSESNTESGSGDGGGGAEAAIRKGIRLTGAKRRTVAKQTLGKQKVQQGNPQTRSVAELDRLVVALRGADETDVCAICLGVYQDTHELVAFDCRHCFHVECVHQWLSIRLAAGVRPCCPLCRTSIKL